MLGFNGGLLGSKVNPVTNIITANEWVVYKRLPLWTPAQIELLLWLDASDTSTLVETSGRISQWSDKSGISRHATQGTAAQRPKQTVSALNGKSVVEFDPASNSFQRLTFSRLAEIGHIFFVAKKNNVNDSDVILTDGSSNDRRGFSFGGGTGSDFTVQQITGSLSTATRNNWHIGEARTNGVNASLGIDGTRTTNTETDVLSSSDIGWYSNSISSFVNQYSFRGQIAEIIFSASTLTTSVRQQVEGYLAHKWALTGNLPSDHPYKSLAPTI